MHGPSLPRMKVLHAIWMHAAIFKENAQQIQSSNMKNLLEISM